MREHCIMLYHTVRLGEEWNMKYISRGPKARVGYITHINRDEVEVDMSVYTTRIREYFDTQIAWRDWKLFEVIISQNISHKGRRPECDIFLDIITSDDFQPPWDISTSKCSRILVVYTFISTSTLSRLIWKISHSGLWPSGDIFDITLLDQSSNVI